MKDTVNRITGTVGVWLTDDFITNRDLLKMASEGDGDNAVSKVNYSNYDMSDVSGWVRAGTATVEITLDDEREIIKAKADNIRKEIQTVRAEAQKKVGFLEDRLGQLLALPSSIETEEGATA